ncbi:MAG: hypothetical protein NXH97_18845 [Rhodobacteraceae bacterium]|nr:hypothetical protein [Paracoccaceae bacterium]
MVPQNGQRTRRIGLPSIPDNLRVVSAAQNRTKCAQGPLEWLPRDRRYHCTYVSDFVAVVEEYDLTLSTTETRPSFS